MIYTLFYTQNLGNKKRVSQDIHLESSSFVCLRCIETIAQMNFLDYSPPKKMGKLFRAGFDLSNFLDLYRVEALTC